MPVSQLTAAISAFLKCFRLKCLRTRLNPEPAKQKIKTANEIAKGAHLKVESTRLFTFVWKAKNLQRAKKKLNHTTREGGKTHLEASRGWIFLKLA